MACQNAASLTQLLPALARSICDVARRPSRLPTHTVPSDLQRNAQPHGLLAPMATFSRASSSFDPISPKKSPPPRIFRSTAGLALLAVNESMARRHSWSWSCF
ncbi:hypothetical protein COCCADRAFT_29380 [Bipolaris zeicola 26-R-13]|uniref:Uncharacterized protein n=1 Tax=Cochliobolus carbonum (strain 26-R-13) TaxID=930089 RepID=W6XQ78_COCC2|nr:uncharacterized protein COCCADRAFT_29380 [Bipolaris zeicola 26-R-13]EUC29562.1 hypothetical protein COCCADRAFT_29380 [Bipolaris zeicola 26-R-13]